MGQFGEFLDPDAGVAEHRNGCPGPERPVLAQGQVGSPAGGGVFGPGPAAATAGGQFRPAPCPPAGGEHRAGPGGAGSGQQLSGRRALGAGRCGQRWQGRQPFLVR